MRSAYGKDQALYMSNILKMKELLLRVSLLDRFLLTLTMFMMILTMFSNYKFENKFKKSPNSLLLK